MPEATENGHVGHEKGGVSPAEDYRSAQMVETVAIRIDDGRSALLARRDDALHRLVRRDTEVMDVAEVFHENTKIRRYRLPELVRNGQVYSAPTILEAASRTERHFAGRPRVELPKPSRLEMPIGECLERRRSCRDFDEAAGVSQLTLSTYLKHAYGVSGRLKAHDEDGRTVWQNLLTVPSGGALYPLELYVLAQHIEGLDRGVYHYNPRAHALEHVLRRGDGAPDWLGCFPAHPEVVRLDRAAFLMVVSGVFWRSKGKYGERSYRLVLQESGHLGQNLLLAAVASGLGALPMAAFYDDEVHQLLDVDGVDEAALYTFACGYPLSRTAEPKAEA